MITEVVINMSILILEKILGIVISVVPQINLTQYMLQYTIKIISICTQANNFIHFIIGDFVVVLVPLTLALLAYKYGVYPIITIIRSVFVNGNN